MSTRSTMPAPSHHVAVASMSRRALLARATNGFGSVALSALLCDRSYGTTETTLPHPIPHHRPRVRSVIFLYMDGGVSQVDSWDPKPRLEREHGQPFGAKLEPTQFNNIGTVLASPWSFRQRGASGITVSELFPHIGGCVDDLAVIRSMVAPFSEHNTANFFLHTGTGMQGRPSMGAWATYGLGSANHELPGFVVLNGGLIPSGGLSNFANGFLPATHQGSVFKGSGQPLANIARLEKTSSLQQNKARLMRKLDRWGLDRIGRVDALESSIANYEVAFRMQAAVPEVVDLSLETPRTLARYGVDAKYGPTQIYARQCLLARRLVERGVRFIELTCPRIGGNDRWDAHSNLVKNHADNARAVDQPIAALLWDLKQRGLLDETLVVWSGEFGRTPFAQGSDGRDHNPFGFSIWLAGGGIRGGTVYGRTDDYGYHAVEGRTEIHDLHATMLHLLGIDHKRLTFRFGGRDMRLTDVAGKLIRPILT